ncbi:UNVERIFIED_CONTAM: hypothetical protein K2H54_059170 [Gekko kuhli]
MPGIGLINVQPSLPQLRPFPHGSSVLITVLDANVLILLSPHIACGSRFLSPRYKTVAGDCEAPEVKKMAEIKPRLQSVAEDLSRCSHSISEHQAIVWCLLSEVEKRRSQIKDDRSIQKMEACLDKMQLIYSQFKKARKCPRLLYNEQQIHKLDKVNLGHLAKKVISVFQDDCAQHYQAALLAHGTRMRKVFEMRKHLKKLNRSLTACSVEISGCQDDLYNVQVFFLLRTLH